MKILFEEYGYSTKSIENVLGDFLLSKLDKEKDKQQLRYVGYFFNNDIVNRDGSKGDLVFILPKVLLDANGLAFGMRPEDIVDFNFKDWKKEELVIEEGKLTKNQVYSFIYGFVTWIYRSISLYRQNLRHKPKKDDNEEIMNGVMSSLQVGQSGKKKDATFVDILLSLLDFQRTHKDFITFAIKIAHSGFNKINWTKTIARTQAIIQDDSPIYINPINKTRVVNFDEELLIIYYSILDYMHEEYGFPIPNQPGYKLIKGALFKSYLKNQGKIRLHKIRYKYYSDDAILLWNLCYNFFDKSDNLKANSNKKDYLLVHKFETVFEGMIDELVGDKELPDGLKISGDDKRIDHLYTYKYLLENLEDRNESLMARNIYHIADSKYYRRDKELKGHDVPKQFTYARNVIQWHMDLLHDLLDKDAIKAKKYLPIKLFDAVTEGYNIIPNFFISAQVDDELNYSRDNFSESQLGNGSNTHESYMFWERLFDRNSYFTLHYDVNFLYILKMYAQNKSYNKTLWKQEVRKKVRSGILKYLKDNFKFYQIMIKDKEIEEFVERHYRKIIGKVFAFEDILGKKVLLYAERASQSDGNGKSYSYDENSDAHIEGNLLVIPTRNKASIYRVESINLAEDSYKDTSNLYPEVAVVGYYKDKAHLDWILANGIYNMRTVQRGKAVPLNNAKIYASHIVLHNEEYGNYVFPIVGDTIYRIKKENLPIGEYIPGNNEYFIYEIDTQSEIDEYLNVLVNSQRFEDKLKLKKPITINIDRLKEMAKIVSIDKWQYEINEEDTFISLVAESETEYSSQ